MLVMVVVAVAAAKVLTGPKKTAFVVVWTAEGREGRWQGELRW